MSSIGLHIGTQVPIGTDVLFEKYRYYTVSLRTGTKRHHFVFEYSFVSAKIKKSLNYQLNLSVKEFSRPYTKNERVIAHKTSVGEPEKITVLRHFLKA